MKQKLASLLYAMMIVFMVAMIIIFPQQVLQASQRGLEVWAGTVFPALLPFFIMAELLIAFGVVHFIGVLFEPIMRPLFRVSGVGGFVWTMGMASGYPSGAKYTARLRQEGQLSQIEAERLVSFTNASNPLFIIGAVGIGFFHDARVGVLLAVTHYLSNFFVGLSMRFYKKSETAPAHTYSFSIMKAFKQLHFARMQKNQAFGKILGEAVTQSIETLIKIGGFIVLFSVITEILAVIHLTEWFASFIGKLLVMVHLPADLAPGLFTGLFEITIGANRIANTESALFFQVIVISIMLAFNGFSVQAQVASILADTDIRFTPYFFARILHACFASGCVILLFKPMYQSESLTTALLMELPQHFTMPMSIVGWLITLSAFTVYLFILFFKFFNQGSLYQRRN